MNQAKDEFFKASFWQSVIQGCQEVVEFKGQIPIFS
jgi:hypothetical protein